MTIDNKYASVCGLLDLMKIDTNQIQHMKYLNMHSDENGYSGDTIERLEIFYKSGSTESFILKKAQLKERLAMNNLTEQGHASIPLIFSMDLHSNSPSWMAMEDLRKSRQEVTNNKKWRVKVAEALAKIHAANMNEHNKIPDIPIADERYWDEVTSTLSLNHFRQKIETDPLFAEEFAHYLPALSEKALEFKKDLTRMSSNNEYLTLTHGDLQTVDGSHVYNCNGNPKIIDFGFCRYAPFYIDAVSYFDLNEADIYFEAFQNEGVFLDYNQYLTDFRKAYRYTNFIYLYPALQQWGKGPTKHTGKRLLQLIYTIIHGEFPENKLNYSDSLFQNILAKHWQRLF